ncbi:inositol polyphosphate multikinase isoform X1 [Alosa sapidissima]|uniref:inositol polyphosphate multikinase isoform X1 n=2 Tax=Alosa sapidissima TaxID=34773 RepID=UPI001C098681|nr:inositol polyphosphate multikinase isoform X1 [Alosa sapidissima]
MSEKSEETNSLAPERDQAPDGDERRLNGCVPLSHQVAGHKYGINKVGILQHPDGTVLKQLQPPPRGTREMHFYTQVFARDCSDPQVLSLRPHLPVFYGTWASSDSPNELYLKLEDVTRRFSRPCIMDLKVGRRSYDPLASPEKRQQQIRKYPLMEEIGFLLLGMRVYQPSRDCYVCHDQFFGRSLGKDTLAGGLAEFFHDGVKLHKQTIRLCIRKVQNILRWFESQKQLHFYASSLLFVYEGASGAHTEAEQNNNHHHHLPPQESSHEGSPAKSSCRRGGCGGDLPDSLQNGGQTHGSAPCLRQSNGNVECEEEEEEEEEGEEEEGGWLEEEGSEGHVEVRMIDFAHVFPSESPDEGYMHGLKNLLSTLRKIIQD